MLPKSVAVTGTCADLLDGHEIPVQDSLSTQYTCLVPNCVLQ